MPLGDTEMDVDGQAHGCFRDLPRGLFCGAALLGASTTAIARPPSFKPGSPHSFLDLSCTRSRASNSSISSFAFLRSFSDTSVGRQSTK
jgi:hypothetical protein